jgi:hypothetical protein
MPTAAAELLDQGPASLSRRSRQDIFDPDFDIDHSGLLPEGPASEVMRELVCVTGNAKAR